MRKYSMTQHELRVLNGYPAAIMLVPLLTVLPLLAACQLAMARARRHAQLQALRSAGGSQAHCKRRQHRSGRLPAPGRSSPLVGEQPQLADMACLPDSYCNAGPGAGPATDPRGIVDQDEATKVPEVERASLRSAAAGRKDGGGVPMEG